MSGDFTILHRNIATTSLMIGGVVAVLSYIYGNSGFAWGLLFGLPLALINLKSIDKTLIIAFGFSSSAVVKGISFVLYHVRFALLVLIMFLVIPKTGLYFGIGTFFGFLIPKIGLGRIILKHKNDEWWLKKTTADQKPKNQQATYLDRKLVERNPFEVNLVDVEFERYLQSVKQKKFVSKRKILQ